MPATLFQSNELVATTLSALMLSTLASAVILFLGLSWTSERWRIPVALSGAALLAAALQYHGLTAVWLETHRLSAAPRFVGWFVVHPLQVASVFFVARIAGHVPVGVFWRTVAAALLMVLSRYLGDARFFNPTLGVLLSIAFWLYILGEMYFGTMADVVRKSSRPLRLGYFWVRLIMTIGWAIYPILHFVDVVIGTGHVGSVIVLYSVADLINLIAISLIVLAVAGEERF